ncbi:MAG: hypothetical protein KDC46_06705 [Thermoleophilia bacterium]|nr:hypothetical protein [Thermoleophilia bacterium]
MQQIELTYEQWMQVHPTYRSIIKRVPHVVAHGDDGKLVLMRVRFMRDAEITPRTARPSAGQLRLPAA